MIDDYMFQGRDPKGIIEMKKYSKHRLKIGIIYIDKYVLVNYQLHQIIGKRVPRTTAGGWEEDFVWVY